MRTFAEAVQSKSFAISAELTVRRESTADDVRRQADLLGRFTDGIQVTDSPYAWVQMSALSASGILIDHGMDPVPIINCRDRNRIALHCDLLGLQALGVSSLILMRGPRVPPGHSTPASTVFDLTGPELIALAASVGKKRSAGSAREFFIGTGARAFRAKRHWQAESLAARAEAGARFVQTQLCFNMEMLRCYMERFAGAGLTSRYYVIVSLSPFPSAATARWVKQNMVDSRIPDSVIERLEEANNPEQEGIQICAELMQEVALVPGVCGVNLMTVGDTAAIPAAIRMSGLRKD